MAEISIAGNMKQGFDFSKDKQVTIGFLTAFKVGELELEADFPLYDPTEDAEATVVGVINHASWSTNKTDGIEISAQVSLKNKKSLKEALLGSLKNGDVECEFRMLEYDSSPDQKKYYVSFSTGDAAVNGSLERSGANLNISVSDTPDPTVQQPENYTLTFRVVPDQQDQDLHMAVGVGANFVKQWGVKA